MIFFSSTKDIHKMKSMRTNSKFLAYAEKRLNNLTLTIRTFIFGMINKYQRYYWTTFKQNLKKHIQR